jgi:hypothetical protein
MRLSTVCFLTALTMALAGQPERDVTFGPNGAFRLEISRDSFGERAHGVVQTINGRRKVYPLPQSTVEEYKKLHPGEYGIDLLTEKNYERQEVIGPHQVEGNKLWFGKDFYHGEGVRGVGAFGFFDTTTGQYQMFSPPPVALWEISAILVEKDSVWMGLDHFGEDISTAPGGLLRWDRETHGVHRYPLEFTVNRIERRGRLLHLGTSRGYAQLQNDVIQRFEIRRAPSGASTVVPVAKFPLPATHN